MLHTDRQTNILLLLYKNYGHNRFIFRLEKVEKERKEFKDQAETAQARVSKQFS